MDGALSNIEQVRRAKARYCRFVDTGRWSELAALFEPAPLIRMLDPDGAVIASFDEVEPFIAVTRHFLEGARSIHQVHNDEIDQVSATEISAIWSMEDLIQFPSPAPGRPVRLNGYGHYHEVWRLGDEGWRIATLELRRTILDVTTALETL